MSAPLQKDPKIFESLLIYLKLGGEKLARVAIEAYNSNQRQLDVEMMRRIREEVLFEDLAEDDEEDDTEDGDEADDVEETEGKKDRPSE